MSPCVSPHPPHAPPCHVARPSSLHVPCSVLLMAVRAISLCSSHQLTYRLVHFSFFCQLSYSPFLLPTDTPYHGPTTDHDDGNHECGTMQCNDTTCSVTTTTMTPPCSAATATVTPCGVIPIATATQHGVTTPTAATQQTQLQHDAHHSHAMTAPATQHDETTPTMWPHNKHNHNEMPTMAMQQQCL